MHLGPLELKVDRLRMLRLDSFTSLIVFRILLPTLECHVVLHREKDATRLLAVAQLLLLEDTQVVCPSKLRVASVFRFRRSKQLQEGLQRGCRRACALRTRCRRKFPST